MNPRRMLVVLSALAVLLLSQSSTLFSQALQRAMYVSVVDAQGAPVPGLTPNDFIVREDNVSREVLHVEPLEEPMQIAILVDNTTAAREEVVNIRRGLAPFVEALTMPMASGRRNEIAIIALAERPTILANYTTDRAPLDKAISRIWEQQPRSGAYLLDALVEVTQGLRKREAARPIIVALTTDGPELSNRVHDQVLASLRAAGATLHVINLGSPNTDLRDETRERGMVIDEGTRTTGGFDERLLTGVGLPARLQQFAQVLIHQYRVTYAHPDSLIPPEHITVAARRPELTARGILVKDPQAKR